jgi:hypothetical protein
MSATSKMTKWLFQASVPLLECCGSAEGTFYSPRSDTTGKKVSSGVMLSPPLSVGIRTDSRRRDFLRCTARGRARQCRQSSHFCLAALHVSTSSCKKTSEGCCCCKAIASSFLFLISCLFSSSSSYPLLQHLSQSL